MRASSGSDAVALELLEVRLRRVRGREEDGHRLADRREGREDRPALVHPLGDDLHERVGRSAEQPDHPVRVARVPCQVRVERGHDRRVAERLLEGLGDLASEPLERRGGDPDQGENDVDHGVAGPDDGLDRRLHVRLARVQHRHEGAEARVDVAEEGTEAIRRDDLAGVAPVDAVDLGRKARRQGVGGERTSEKGSGGGHRTWQGSACGAGTHDIAHQARKLAGLVVAYAALRRAAFSEEKTCRIPPGSRSTFTGRSRRSTCRSSRGPRGREESTSPACSRRRATWSSTPPS